VVNAGSPTCILPFLRTALFFHPSIFFHVPVVFTPRFVLFAFRMLRVCSLRAGIPRPPCLFYPQIFLGHFDTRAQDRHATPAFLLASLIHFPPPSPFIPPAMWGDFVCLPRPQRFLKDDEARFTPASNAPNIRRLRGNFNFGFVFSVISPTSFVLCTIYPRAVIFNPSFPFGSLFPCPPVRPPIFNGIIPTR